MCGKCHVPNARAEFDVHLAFSILLRPQRNWGFFFASGVLTFTLPPVHKRRVAKWFLSRRPQSDIKVISPQIVLVFLQHVHSYAR